VSQSSQAQVEAALARLETVEPLVNAVCTPNPDALATAAALDREAAEGRSRNGIRSCFTSTTCTGPMRTAP
jgi:amidase